jgi:hypothetical protein
MVFFLFSLGGVILSPLEIEIEIYLVELHRHRTVPQLTPGFCGAQVRYISIYKLSIYKPSTHILPKVLMPVAIANVTIPPLSSLPISTPKLYFDSQIPLGGVVSAPAESIRYVGHCWPIVPAPDDR